MLNQLFQRQPTKKEFDKLLKCYNINHIDEIHSITYLSIKVYNTINKLYNMIDILLEIYLPCKYKFLNNLNVKRTLTILRQVIRLFDLKLNKFKIGNQSFYKIEKNDKSRIKIKNNVNIIF